MTEGLFHFNYEVTPKLLDDFVKQYYWHELLRPRRIFGMLLVLAFVLGTIATPYDSPPKSWAVGFLSAVTILLVAAWVRAYFQFLAQERAGLKLMEHPNVKISMDDARIEYASSTGTRRHQWEKIDRILQTKDFVILMSGKLPLLSLPKLCFSIEALAFMEDRVAATKKEARRVSADP
jgi:hypothetical protein